MEKIYVKIRYKREDKEYDGWNLWIWEDEKEGEMVDFIWEDSLGKFAIIETTNEYAKIGFRLRQSILENEWAQDYFGEDKFVDLNTSKEVVINHTDKVCKTIEEQELAIKYEKVVLNLHYYTFDDERDVTQKYVNLNSFVKLAKDNDNMIDAYFVQGDENIYIDQDSFINRECAMNV